RTTSDRTPNAGAPASPRRATRNTIAPQPLGDPDQRPSPRTRAKACSAMSGTAGTMTGTTDDEDFTLEQIASELKRIAELLRHGPIDPAEVEKLTAQLEKFAAYFRRSPGIDPALPQRLQELAAQLRTGPAKRNGSNP